MGCMLDGDVEIVHQSSKRIQQGATTSCQCASALQQQQCFNFDIILSMKVYGVYLMWKVAIACIIAGKGKRDIYLSIQTGKDSFEMKRGDYWSEMQTTGMVE